jgi:L-seryl-tRNA(Ser) seleniumtransferase
MARQLRLGDPGIFGRIDQDRLVLDLRTVLPEDDQILLRSLRHSLR